MRAFLAAALSSACLVWTVPALAACSREIQVPVASFGYSVVVQGASVSGIFPELLQDMGAKSRCTFHWSVVTRARLEVLFENGGADMLLAATQSDQRDQSGRFVPLVWGRAILVSLADPQRPPIRDMRQLVAQRELRVVLVRGFDYGPAYQDLIRTLSAQGRLFLAPDPLTVARMLSKGMADLTIMPPSVILNIAQNDKRVEDLLGKLRYEALEELPWIKSGIYLSTKSLAASDLDYLEQALAAIARDGGAYRAYARIFPADVLKLSMRPLR